jgi:hypothetical protein
MANPTIELDFGFLVFGQIGAPYRQTLILVKAGTTRQATIGRTRRDSRALDFRDLSRFAPHLCRC